VRALGFILLLLSAGLPAVGCGAMKMEERVFHWFLGTPFFLGGGSLLFFGC
jgi:hypothetical protein